MENHISYIKRCMQLARLGTSAVTPNPLVGALLLYNNRIIGEGYHRKHGTAHAEVQAVNSVRISDKHLIPESTLYVSLEPCCIFGKTPPCTQLILSERIPRVVISCQDKTPEVCGAGIKILKDAGVEVTSGILEEDGKKLVRFRTSFAEHKRPFIILKFAVSADYKMGLPNQHLWLSNSFSKRWVHRVRQETSAILVGTRTVEVDNPALNTRFGFRHSPVRIIPDLKGALTSKVNVFRGTSPVIILTEDVSTYPVKVQGPSEIVAAKRSTLLKDVLNVCMIRGLNSLLVEGGPSMLQSFIDANLWDEAYIIHTPHILGSNGIPAPTLPGVQQDSFKLGDDQIVSITNPHPLNFL